MRQTFTVLHVIESLGRGGAEQLLVTLLPEMARHGVRCVVAVRGGSMDLRPALEAAGIAVRCLRKRHRWNLLASAHDVAECARDENARLIHAHLYFPGVIAALVRMLGLSSARTVITFHNLAYAGANRDGVGLRVRRWLAARVYPRGIDVCLAVSEAVARHYEAALSLRDIKVVHNAVDIDALSRISSERARGLPLHIVVPGRFVPEKGHEDFISALAALRDRGHRIQVSLAGEGPLRRQIELRIERLGLKDQVAVSGAMQHDNLLRLIASADVVVIPSRFEGFGLAALEAMALGRPVVATRSGGLQEVVGEAGVLVPPASPEALAEALGSIMEDASRRAALGEAGRKRASRMFALPVIAEKLARIYRESLVAEDPRDQAA